VIGVNVVKPEKKFNHEAERVGEAVGLTSNDLHRLSVLGTKIAERSDKKCKSQLIEEVMEGGNTPLEVAILGLMVGEGMFAYKLAAASAQASKMSPEELMRLMNSKGEKESCGGSCSSCDSEESIDLTGIVPPRSSIDDPMFS